MDTNENVMAGYAIDPTTVYGGSLHQQTATRLDGGDSARIIEDSPVDGPQAVTDATTSPGLLGFVRSPAGVLLILVPIAFCLWGEVFD